MKQEKAHNKNTIEAYGLSERYRALALAYPEWQLGRIIAQYRGLYKVSTDEGEKLFEISGKMRHEAQMRDEYPAVGDFVMVDNDREDEHGIIHAVLPRKSMFARKAAGSGNQGQTIAANIDTVFLCMSLNKNYNLSRLERYLAVAWDSGATPVIVLTKTDLCEDLEGIMMEVERVSAFSDIINVSMFDEGIDEKFAPYLAVGKTAAFIGSSGVGKSTLINRLLGEEALATSDIGKDDKGRHTTTGREMFPARSGGAIIDTPGMRELGVDSADLGKSFDDIEILISGCKFTNCTHTNEKGCAVLAALEGGELDQRRWNNYLKLANEASYEGLGAKELEKKKMERMFKEVGGMKNARKFIKNRVK